MDDINRRKNTRYSCLSVVDSKKGTYFDDSITVDISKSGMGFVSATALPLRKKIAVELDLTEEGDPVFVIGQVKWVVKVPNVEQYRVGMSFVEVLPGSKSRLEKYFRK